MKVLDLQCAQRHSFEGWFGSEADFLSQLERGLVECPMCADSNIQKMPSAPRLNLGGYPVPAAESNTSQASAPASTPALTSPRDNHAVVGSDQVGSGAAEQAAFLHALRHVLANTEDVGKRFVDEARAMHYGDAEARNIRGQASAREAVELLEEGIAVLPLPMPAALKETLQ